MIQRIQSLYLLIVVLFSVLIFFLPISTKIITANPAKNISKDVTYKTNLTGIEKYETGVLVSSSSNFVLMILIIAAGFVAAAVIFLYKKRMVQIKFTRLSLLLTAAFIVFDYYFSDALGSEYGEGYKTIYLSGSYFPIIQIILLIMAIRAIKKDEELVRSADRIR